jgi:2-keto-4-pentenoate hydratase
MAVHPRVLEAHRAQLERRRAVLATGARHVGWKVGLGIPGAEELIGRRPVFGHLTSASRLDAEALFSADAMRELQVDCELAVTLGRDVLADGDVDAVRGSIAGAATALELCDVGRPPDDFDSIVAANVFHRAFVLGPGRPAREAFAPALRGRVWVNGVLRHEADAEDTLTRILAIARLLEAVGERLRAGDWVICGAASGGLVMQGDEVEVGIAALGNVRVTIA